MCHTKAQYDDIGLASAVAPRYSRVRHKREELGQVIRGWWITDRCLLFMSHLFSNIKCDKDKTFISGGMYDSFGGVGHM